MDIGNIILTCVKILVIGFFERWMRMNKEYIKYAESLNSVGDMIIKVSNTTIRRMKVIS